MAYCIRVEQALLDLATLASLGNVIILPMKVVVRSSSLLFFLVSILLDLPVYRRNLRIGNGHVGVTPRQATRPIFCTSPTEEV